VLSDEFFKFIPMSLFEVECWGSSVGLAIESKLEIDVYGEVVGAKTWKEVPITFGS